MFVENPYTNTLFIDYFLCFFGVVRTITKCVYIVEKDDCVHISAQLIRLKKRKKKHLFPEMWVSKKIFNWEAAIFFNQFN